jgi:hypothetical protein
VGDDRATQSLVTEPRTTSAEQCNRWGEHRVYQRTHGSKRLRHRIVGELVVAYEALGVLAGWAAPAIRANGPPGP